MKTQITRAQYDRAVAAIPDLQRQMVKMNRGRFVPSAKTQTIIHQINLLKEIKEAYERQEKERLRFTEIPFDRIKEIIAVPLVADVLNDLVAGVNGTLREYGCSETVFAERCRELTKIVLSIVDVLQIADESMPKLLEHNDMLVDAVKKKVLSYISQRLKVTDR